MSLGVHLRAFLRDPKGVAALTPTSPGVCRRIAARLAPERTRVVVEFGPGGGVLTRALLERLPPDGRLVAIERNAELAAWLGETIRDARLTLVNDSAERVQEHLGRLGLPAADYILTGIPFFWLPPEAADRIVERAHGALAAGGSLVAYQMFYLRRRHLQVHLERHFGSVHAALEMRHLPPYRIYEAVK